MQVQDRILSFLEKPKDPPGMPDNPAMALASMGIYVFATRVLIDQLRRDAADPGSSRDFGKDLIPYLVQHGTAVAHRFPRSCVRSSHEADAYWRDVGTLDAYWAANIDLTHATPALDLYDTAWPIWTNAEITPPAKVIQEAGRRGEVVNSVLSGGCIVAGAAVRDSLLFTGTRVHPDVQLQEAVVLPGVEIARSARLRKVIVDRGVRIPQGLAVGEDPELDARRFRRTDSGICLITQPMVDRLEA
jgi:glucose-1-phosphate adenylyltransferase